VGERAGGCVGDHVSDHGGEIVIPVPEALSFAESRRQQINNNITILIFARLRDCCPARLRYCCVARLRDCCIGRLH
jgi:hypothetical protein